MAELRDFERTSVPSNRLRGFWSMFLVMTGFTFFSASMMAGGVLGEGLEFHELIVTILCSNLLLGLYTGLLAWISGKTRLSIHLLARYSFGTKGSCLPSSMLILTQIGWFGVGVMMFSIPISVVLCDSNLFEGTWIMQGYAINFSTATVPIPLRLLSVIAFLSGAAMTTSAYLGIRAMIVVSAMAVPAITVLGIHSIYRALYIDQPETIGAAVNGMEYIFNYSPTEKMSIITALSIAIGAFISNSTCAPDFARFSSSPKTAVISTFLAFFIGNSLMFLFGAIGAMVYHENDISYVLNIQGLLGAAIMVLGLNIWTTNDNALYTAALGIANIVKSPRRFGVLASGIIGTMSSIVIYQHFAGWLEFLCIFIPPIGAIIIVDYFMVCKGKYSHIRETKFADVKWTAISAWTIGSVVAALVYTGSFKGFLAILHLVPQGFSIINGMLASAVSYLFLDHTNKQLQAKKAKEAMAKSEIEP